MVNNKKPASPSTPEPVRRQTRQSPSVADSPMKETEKVARKQTPKDGDYGRVELEEITDDSSDNAQEASETDDSSATPVTSASKQRSIVVPKKDSSNSCLWITLVSAAAVLILGKLIGSALDNDSGVTLPNKDWRSKVDPNASLTEHQLATVLASLKPILDKSPSEDQSVSTLLLLSSNETNAAQLAHCLLKTLNRIEHRNQLSSEINLQLPTNDKLRLDQDLEALLTPDDGMRAVLLRHIDDLVSGDAFERLRLLFAYCDGENPRVAHRLIIMTAASHSTNENDLREAFKEHWPKEHDFIDALMSRISGHTLYVQADQRSIC